MKLLSTRISNGPFNTAMIILRLGLGILLMHHGYEKLMAFSSMKDHFMSFMHLGSTVTLSLVIFTEFFCATMVIIGLFTRFACLAIVIEFIYAFIVIHQAKPFAVLPDWNGEPALLYLTGFLALLLCGPGKVSVDGMISK